MAEYIERERLIAEIRAVQHYCLVSEVAVNVIKHLPSADVVEVVRCKDCKWCEDMAMSGMYCNHPDGRNTIHCRPDDFCNDGERKDG